MAQPRAMLRGVRGVRHRRSLLLVVTSDRLSGGRLMAAPDPRVPASLSALVLPIFLVDPLPCQWGPAHASIRLVS